MIKRKLRRIGRRIRNHLNYHKILMSILVIIFLALIIFYIISQLFSQKTYEITEIDVLSLKDLSSRDISVKGLKLGDSLENIIDKLGYPDSQLSYLPNILNIEYGKRLNLEDVGLIFHLEDDKITRITIKEPFNKFLVGKTKINNTKAEIYYLLGIPEKVDKIPLKENSILLMRLYRYTGKGIEVIIRQKEQNALSLVEPQ